MTTPPTWRDEYKVTTEALPLDIDDEAETSPETGTFPPAAPGATIGADGKRPPGCAP